jgi:wyosine [tRNA(Phe)-imidazoG37] synthetase (radical SAM superfamily)
MLEELKRIYPAVKDHLDVVTVTGSGEPTLNIDLHIIAAEIKKIISHPLVLLTNATLVTDDNVKDAMSLYDIIVPSVDAVSEEVFKKINRPHPSLNLINILNQLREFSHNYHGKLFIEVLLVEGINDNFEEIGKIATYIKTLKYDKVQLNTVFRPPAYPDAKGLTQEKLLEIAIFFKKEGIKVEPVGNFIGSLGINDNIMVKIKSLLDMRPCTVEDIASIFDIDKSEILDITGKLEDVTAYTYNGETFFKGKKPSK